MSQQKKRSIRRHEAGNLRLPACSAFKKRHSKMPAVKKYRSLPDPQRQVGLLDS